MVCGSIFSGLVGIDFNLKPVPDLATSWEVSPDGQRYVFHLAPNATFHDGNPVTSADVKFTFEQLLLKYHSRTRTSIGDKLKAIITPDDGPWKQCLEGIQRVPKTAGEILNASVDSLSSLLQQARSNADHIQGMFAFGHLLVSPLMQLNVITGDNFGMGFPNEAGSFWSPTVFAA